MSRAFAFFTFKSLTKIAKYFIYKTFLKLYEMLFYQSKANKIKSNQLKANQTHLIKVQTISLFMPFQPTLTHLN